MTRVKGLVFVSLFGLALSAQPVLAQDRNSDLPTPISRGTNTEASPDSPQNNKTTKPRRQRADGTYQRHRRHLHGDPSQAHGSNGNKRQGPPPSGQPPQGGDTAHN